MRFKTQYSICKFKIVVCLVSCTFVKAYPKEKGTMNSFKWLPVGGWCPIRINQSKIKSSLTLLFPESRLYHCIFNTYLIYQEGKKKRKERRREKGRRKSFEPLTGQIFGLINKLKYSFLKQQPPFRALHDSTEAPTETHSHTATPSPWSEWEIPLNLTEVLRLTKTAVPSPFIL